MAYRNLTSKFFNLKPHDYIIDIKNTKDDSLINTKTTIINNIKRTNEELRKYYKHSSNTVFGDVKKYNKLIDDKLKLNKQYFTDAIHFISSIDDVYRNIKMGFFNEVNELKEEFIKDRFEYESSIKKKTNRYKEYGIEDKEFEDFKFKLYEKGLTDEQMKEILDNKRDIIERDKMLKDTLTSLTDLQNIMNDFSMMVKDQDEYIDLIDRNLIKADEYVNDGKKDLEDGEKTQKYSSYGIWLLLLMIVLICICMGFGILVIIKLSIK